MAGSYRLFSTILFAALWFTGFAQHNSIRFNQLTIKDGLSQSSLNCIIQDSKGFIWIGTQDGLNRFDGYNFLVYKNNRNDSTSISDNFIHAVIEDKNRDLWVGTDHGLNRFDRAKQTFSSFKYNPKNKNSVSSNHISALLQDKRGNVWVGTAESGLDLLTRDSKGNIHFKHFKAEDGNISSNFISSLFEDKSGKIWIGTLSGGITIYDPLTNSFVNIQKNPSLPNSLSNNMVWCIVQDQRGRIWVGTNDGLNLYHEKSKSFSVYRNNPSANHSISGNIVKSAFVDEAGVLWIGTSGAGLNRYNEKAGTFDHFNNLSYKPNSLGGDNVLSIFQDRTGIMWVGTNSGLSKFDRYKQNFEHIEHIDNIQNTLSSGQVWSLLEDEKEVIWVGTDDGLNSYNKRTETFKRHPKIITEKKQDANSSVYSLFKDSRGRLLAGTDEGLFVFDEGKSSIVKLQSKDKLSNQLNNRRVYEIFEDKDKNVWIGTKEGLMILDKDQNKYVIFQSSETEPGSLASNVVRCIIQDHKGQIWIGTNGGGLSRAIFGTDGKISNENISFENYLGSETSQGINNSVILSMYEDPAGYIWLGTFGGGLNKFDPVTGRATYFTESDGLSNNVVYGILADSRGNLWMSTNKGLSNFDPIAGKFKNFYENDGLQSNEFNIGAYFKNKKGQMYFGGINGFNIFYPGKVQINPLPPKMVVTDFQVFNKSVKVSNNSPLQKHISIADHITLTHKENIFSFEFAALHYSYPAKNQYAYMMEGFDEQWNNVGTRRFAVYTKLDPGTYVFKVKGANSDGVWNEEGASLTITIKPPFWQTWWFRILAAVIIIGSTWAFYRWRLSEIKAQKERLENMVAERTAKIITQKEEIEKQKYLVEIEKDKVEKLLLNILPEDTAEELKTKGKASARHYRTASVMFTDFVGFTQIAEKLRPKELVEELDRYFIEFDNIIEKYGIEKIKTIGDAYMCAGGLPIRNKSNPIDIILAGLEIQRYMAEQNRMKLLSGEDPWNLRIGINSGELIAGVVGTKRFAYDIWGDTVNIASRMESSGENGKVNISGTTYEMACEFFECTYRGRVAAKNKGDIEMYFVERIRPELSVDGLGIEPNEAFQRKMTHVLYSKILYRKAEKFILELLSKQLPEGLFYHGLHHTIDVCNSAEKIAFMEGIEGEDVFLIKTAALFHDAGFTKEYAKNEPIGIQLSKEILPQFGYSDKQIEAIEGMILATQVPQNPKNHLEQILCDADLDYLGREDFYPISETLKKELYAFGKLSDDKTWDELQIKFLEAHQYFTATSKQLRQPHKLMRIQEIKQRLVENKYESSLVKE